MTIRNEEVLIKKFRQAVWGYYRKHKRSFPWRDTWDPYRIFVSEIMLQQTQTSRVLQKYPGFLEKFPDFATLAVASSKDVLLAWQGLGYNRRALALKKTSEVVIRDYHGILPKNIELLLKLPGIGKATAGAIIAFAFNKRAIFIETNIRRAYIHFFFQHRRIIHDKDIYALVAKTADRHRSREWYFALMDYGAMLRKLPQKPNMKSRHYNLQSPFAGSERELRGKIIKELLAKKSHTTVSMLARATTESSQRIKNVLRLLERDGMIRSHHNRITIIQ